MFSKSWISKRMSKLIIAIVITSAFSLYGCSSGSTNNEETDFGDNFVSSDSGSLRLVVSDSSLAVGQITSFSVQARGVDGSGASDVRVTCDSEAGLAITEPTSVNDDLAGNASTGFTDDFGDLSGGAGCERAGSYRIRCSAANMSSATSIRCEGDGFASFAGSAGGGLGGGVTDTQDDVDDLAGVIFRTLQLAPGVSDGGEFGTQVDINQDVCEVNPDSGEVIFEPFVTDSFSFEVENRTDTRITFTTFEFSVPEASGSGTAAYNSGPVSFLLVVDAGSETTPATGSAQVPSFLTTNGGDKRGAGVGFIFGQIGDRNVTVRLTGTDEQGDSFSISATTTIDFLNLNNCP